MYYTTALQMLKQFSKGPVSALSDVWPTISYLQNLRGEHIDLVLEYSKWIIKVSTDLSDPGGNLASLGTIILSLVPTIPTILRLP
jgi:hypothetical protein